MATTTGVKDIFQADTRRFECEGLVGSGANGQAWRFKVTGGRVRGVIRFAVKIAHGNAGVDKIQKEIELTKRMYGAAHVAQPVVSMGDMLKPNSDMANYPPWMRIFLVTNWIDGISLDAFLHRLTMRQMYGAPPVPNRVLWILFLCLVRMVLGLAEPPDRPYRDYTEEPSLEPLPGRERTRADYQILHNDMDNYQNFKFGNLDMDEHRLVPKLMLLDFGEAIDRHAELANAISAHGITADTITSANIYAIGNVIRRCYGHYNAANPAASWPNLDMDLYDLAGQCAEKVGAHRPSMTELYTRVRDAIATKTGPDSFRGKSHSEQETNANIMGFVRDTIYSAGTA
ncbi:hypothetical protein F4780DRAFT_110185 [Xylariomycetidae sp. FL0641]|nr:hypothetical protein F4780DRAFT_110185 [Xylariomycetidae sp. FL0641]